MAQRSLHVVIKVYYESYVRLSYGSRNTIAMLRFPGVDAVPRPLLHHVGPGE
jgi:hypothetical protein